MMKSETITVRIDRPAAEVYEFLREPRNLPSWTSMPGPSFEHLSGNDWATEAATGRIIYRYADRNPYFVLDHAVFAEGTEPFTTPMRIVSIGEGSEVLYTLIQRPGMTDAELASEREWVKADFLTLKTLMEARNAKR